MIIFLLLSLLSGPSIASDFDCYNPKNLKKFHQSPKEYMNQKIVKYTGSDCGVVKSIFFTEEEIKKMAYVEIKDQQRKNICNEDGICLNEIAAGSNISDYRAGYTSMDDPATIVSGQNMITDIFKLQEAGLNRGETKKDMWSDYYWPIAFGGLSYRYASSEFTNFVRRSDHDLDDTWKVIFDYLQDYPANYVENINDLSPAEKYDLLVGDENFTLTQANAEGGRYYYENYGNVEAWMGICHGWAPASYMMKRPVKSVTLTAHDGETQITFRPTDIKALASLLWASNTYHSKFVGGRCNDKEPETDENGRIQSQECFDNNPGAWHIAVTNEIGANKNTFVMDATYDYEVWNHPISSYSTSYFNPVTMDFSGLKESIVAIKDFNNDKFKSYRDERTKYVVGVTMSVRYLVEIIPL
jgi:hypothetical protein